MNLDVFAGFKGIPRSAKFATGVIKYFQPDKKAYAVSINYDRIRTCQPLTNGARVAYNPGDHVVVACIDKSVWLILGEYDSIPALSEVEPTSASAEIAKQRSQLDAELSVNQANIDYLQTDSLGKKEEPEFSGDATLSNKANPFSLRAFFKVFSFGDLLAKCTDACFIYLNKKTNLLFLKASEFVLKTRGISISTKVKTNKENAYQTIVQFKVHGDAREDTLDKYHQIGYIDDSVTVDQSAFGKATTVRGERVVYSDNIAFEIDNETKTVRLVQGDITVLLGNLNKEASGRSTFSQPVYQLGAPVSSGLAIKLGDYSITFDSDANSLVIEKDQQSVKLASDGISLTNGLQSIKLGDVGLDIDVESYNLNVTGNSTENIGGTSREVSGDKSIQSGQIALTGQTIRLN